MQNNNMGMYQANHPGMAQQNNHRIAPAPAPNNSLNEQRERLAREIAQLQQQQEHLEAIARITKQQSQGPPILPPQASNVNTLPTAEQLLKTLDQPLVTEHLYDVNQNKKNQQKVTSNYRDEYRQSVIEIMGTKHSSNKSTRSTKSGRSSCGRSIGTAESGKSNSRNISRKKSDEKSNSSNSNVYMDLMLKNSYDRDSEFETRSQNSWMGNIKLNNFDDVSMTSSTILSPGSSVKHNFQTDDLEPEPLHPRDYNHDSRETITTSNHTKKSEKSLSSFECAILDSMISPANIGGQSTNFALPNIYEGQNHPVMPPPRSRLPNQKSNTSMLSAGSSRPTLHEHKASSNVSMMSDLTDTSLSKKDSLSLSRYSNKFSKTKSDNSMGMSDNLSDLSEAMGSLDMK